MPLNPQNVKPGQEQHEYYYPHFRGKRNFNAPGTKLCQYDYRHTDGDLFSCIAETLDQCREKRDEWLSKKTQ